MSFVTAINCMDGRVQLPVIEYLRDRFDAAYVDVITEPAPNRILAGREQPGSGSIFRRVDISTACHGSRRIAVVGHADCSGNPAGCDEQNAQTRTAAGILRERYPDAEIVALWVDETWAVHELER